MTVIVRSPYLIDGTLPHALQLTVVIQRDGPKSQTWPEQDDNQSVQGCAREPESGVGGGRDRWPLWTSMRAHVSFRRRVRRALTTNAYALIRVHGSSMSPQRIRRVKFPASPLPRGYQSLSTRPRHDAAVTTDGQPKLISRAREAGAKGWLMKPIKEDLLIIPVRRLAGDA